MPTHKGQSKVDVGHLIKVIIPKQYKIDIHQASLVELIANALDAKPSTIYINLNESKGTLEVIDDGKGMNGETFHNEYHDITPSKELGTGIGFAGQGAKLALNFCSKVSTETFSNTYKGFSDWHLEDRDAPYEIEDDRTISLSHNGTKVTLYLNDESRGYYTAELIGQVLSDHYAPLLDSESMKVYTGQLPIYAEKRGKVSTFKPIYSTELTFLINGKEIKQPLYKSLREMREVWITIAKKRVRGVFGLIESENGDNSGGVAISCYGKVIERSWFKQEPREKERIWGWIEAPPLIKIVTTDKCGFQYDDPIWKKFFRNAQAEFSKWLEESGFSEKPSEKRVDFSELESEIKSILANLPELAVFGTKLQREVAIPDEEGEPRAFDEGIQIVRGTKGGETEGEGLSVYPGDDTGLAPTGERGQGVVAKDYPRVIRGGIQILPEERPDLETEARFDGDIIYLNISHPAYKRADKERLLRYHWVKAIAFSLIEFKLEREPQSSYQDALELSQKFFKYWGAQ